LALTLNDEIQHAVERHRNAAVVYVCEKCGKRYVNKRSALIHVPKCAAPRPPPISGMVCEACGEVFASRSGLSQHERHEHPEVRNAARAGGSTTSGRPGTSVRVFSEEEERLMLELEVRFRGDKYIARRMTEFFPTKTNKQLRDKRATSTYKNRLREILQQEDARREAENRVEEQDEEDDASQEANERPASPAGEQRRLPRYNLRSAPHRVERQVAESDAFELPSALPATPVIAARRSEDEQPRADLGDREQESRVPEAPHSQVAREVSASRLVGELCDGGELANTPEIISWREKVVRQVLRVEVEYSGAVPPEAAACVQLLKEVLAEIADGNLPGRERMEEVDKIQAKSRPSGEACEGGCELDRGTKT